MLDLLIPLGRSEYQILVYGIYPTDSTSYAYATLQAKLEQSEHRIFELSDDVAVYSAVLVECCVKSKSDILTEMSRFMNYHLELDSCAVVACMFDGSYGGIDNFLSAELARYTYAAANKTDQMVVSLDTGVLESEGWVQIIEQFRRQVPRR